VNAVFSHQLNAVCVCIISTLLTDENDTALRVSAHDGEHWEGLWISVQGRGNSSYCRI
jgi:hypothetical protein